MRPLAIDLFCGLGGWTEGLLEEGYDVIGFDIERHEYGDHKYPAQLVIQDVLTIHGSQFKDAALIVASPPCQAYSYRAMPWKRAKALPPPDNTLFDACFRIQREACEAAGHHVPLVVENVRGAQKWVGRAAWHYGSFYLWGDVPALMPFAKRSRATPRPCNCECHGDGEHQPGGCEFCSDSNHMEDQRFGDGMKAGDAGWRERGPGRQLQDRAIKNSGGSWFNIGSPGQKVVNQNPTRTRRTEVGSGARFTSIEKRERDEIKCGGDWFNGAEPSQMSYHGSKSNARKAASAMIAKIPIRLSRHIARCYYPQQAQAQS